MFYEVRNLTSSVDVPPRYFGPQLKDHVTKLLVEKVQWSHIHLGAIKGFAVHAYVPDIGSYDLTKGKIHEDTGAVQFNVKYNAIVMKPQAQDVFDAIVTDVSQTGVVCQFGPLYIYISYTGLDTFKYDSSGQWRQQEPNEDGEYESISVGSTVRLKVTHVRLSRTGLDVYGTLDAEGCGCVDDPPDE